MVYVKDLKSIGLTLYGIEVSYLENYSFSPYINKFLCRTEDIFLSGIEEAYHHYQFSKRKKYYQKHWLNYKNNSENHYTNPIETDAQDFCRKTSRKFNFKFFPDNNKQSITEFYKKLSSANKKHFKKYCHSKNEWLKAKKSPISIDLPPSLKQKVSN